MDRLDLRCDQVKQRNYSDGKILKYSLYAAAVLLPVITLSILSLLSGNNCFTGRAVSSDEIDYWREMYSFSSTKGFGFGQYGLYIDYPANIGSLGCHGLAPVIAYGTFALLFNWNLNSVLVCNAILCCCALAVFIAVVRPNVRKTVLIIVLWCIYLPIILYMPTSMMEMPQYAFLIVYVAFIIKSIEGSRNINILILLFALVSIMSILRLNNIVLFIPLILIGSDFSSGKRLFWLGTISAGLSIAVKCISDQFTAGYIYSFLYQMQQEPTVIGKVQMILANAGANLTHIFGFSDGIVQTSQRFGYIFIFFYLVFLAIWIYRSSDSQPCFGRTKKNWVGSRKTSYRTVCVAAVVLALELVIVVTAYDAYDYRDYRTLAPILWATILLMLMILDRKRMLPIIICCGLCLLIGGTGLNTSNCACMDTARYRPPVNYHSDWASLIVAGGAGKEDKTLVLISDDLNVPVELPYTLDPSIGYVYCFDTEYLDKGYHAQWVFSNYNIELSGYTVVYSSDDGTLLRYYE